MNVPILAYYFHWSSTFPQAVLFACVAIRAIRAKLVFQLLELCGLSACFALHIALLPQIAHVLL